MEKLAKNTKRRLVDLILNEPIRERGIPLEIKSGMHGREIGLFDRETKR
jgi:hypothetical protein